MFDLLLICFIFFLNVSVCRTTDVPIEVQLKKSVTHLTEMLIAIEGKIKQEKEKLSQINNHLNHQDNLPVARTNATVFEPPIEDLTPTHPDDNYTMETTSTSPVAVYTFATMFPTPAANTQWPPTKIPDTTVITKPVFLEPPMATTTLSPFVQDMVRVMKEDNHNYFTAALSRLMEIIALKDPGDTMPVLNKFMNVVTEKLKVVMFDDEMGQRLTETLNDFAPTILAMDPVKLREQALFAHFIIKHKGTEMSPYYQNMTDFYGKYFNKEDGENLFKALEAFYEYNNGRHSAAEVTDMIASAALTPYIRYKKNRRPASTLNTTTKSAVNAAKSSVYVTESAVHESEPAVHVTESPVYATNYPMHISRFPSPVQRVSQYRRRNINIEKNIRLGQIKHKHWSLKRKLDHGKNRDGYSNGREIRFRAYIPTEEVYNQPKLIQDTVTDHMHHMIRQSSYSDEEDHLKNKLYDALRYGNRTFV